MEAHYNPKKSEAVQRYKFNSRIRHSRESVSTYITELKKLAIHCGFNDVNTLKSMLCDRLVCGINDSRMQHRLLAEPDLNYEKALKIVLAMESAAESTSSLEKQSLKLQVAATPVCIKLVVPSVLPRATVIQANTRNLHKTRHATATEENTVR